MAVRQFDENFLHIDENIFTRQFTQKINRVLVIMLILIFSTSTKNNVKIDPALVKTTKIKL